MYLVLNAQLPPTNPEDISNIVFPEDGEAQVTIPASAIIHQRNTEGTYAKIYHKVQNSCRVKLWQIDRFRVLVRKTLAHLQYVA